MGNPCRVHLRPQPPAPDDPGYSPHGDYPTETARAGTPAVGLGFIEKSLPGCNVPSHE